MTVLAGAVTAGRPGATVSAKAIRRGPASVALEISMADLDAPLLSPDAVSA